MTKPRRPRKSQDQKSEENVMTDEVKEIAEQERSVLDYSFVWTLVNPEHDDSVQTLILDHIYPQLPDGVSFNLADFAEGIGLSFSLSYAEKRRVFDAMPDLSQFQIDELIFVMKDEQSEFDKLMANEHPIIFRLYLKAIGDWLIITLGAPYGTWRLVQLLKDELDGKKRIIEDDRFDDDAKYYWDSLLWLAVFFGAPQDYIERCLTAVIKKNGGDEREALLRIVPSLYESSLEPDWNPSVTAKWRARAVEKIMSRLSSEKLSIKQTNILARTYAFGIAKDWYRIGDKQQYMAALDKAISLLECCPEQTTLTSPTEAQSGLLSELFERQYSDGDTTLLSKSVKDVSSNAFILDLLSGVKPEGSKQWTRFVENNIDDHRLIDAFSYSDQGRVMNDLLVNYLRAHREDNPRELSFYAANLLVWATLTGDQDLQTESARVLKRLVASILNEDITPEWDRKSLGVYESSKILVWLAPRKVLSEEECDKLDSRISSLYHQCFLRHEKNKQADRSGLSIWLFRAIRVLETPDDRELVELLISSIRTHLEQYDVLLYLYAFAKAERIRPISRRLGKEISNLSKSRMHGIRLELSLTKRFLDFFSEKDRYGGHPDEIDKWQGALRLIDGKRIEKVPG